MGFFDRIVPRRSVSVLPDDRILRYKITGINPGTRRKNTRRVLCGSGEAISDVEARTGLLPPFTCELELPEVTEAQLELMGKLNVPLLDGIYRAAASSLIQPSQDDMPLLPHQCLPRPILQYLIAHNML